MGGKYSLTQNLQLLQPLEGFFNKALESASLVLAGEGGGEGGGGGGRKEKLNFVNNEKEKQM